MTIEQLNEIANLHPAIQKTLDSDMPVNHKHEAMGKLYRTLFKAGAHTGISDDKMKKGSSRAVYFPSEHDDLVLDGQPVKVKSVLKVAYPSSLERYHNADKYGGSLGELQNMNEAGIGGDHSPYSLFRKDEDGNLRTNENGVFAPVLGHHDDHHYLHMVQAEKFNAPDFREATKTPEFPKGISPKHAIDYVKRDYKQNVDRHTRYDTDDEKLDKIADHPWVQSLTAAVQDYGLHPTDFVTGNLGIITHPITGKKHPVLIDYGFTDDTARAYDDARSNRRVVFRNRMYGW